MAARLLSYVVSDLCLGKPPLPYLPASATVRHALTALKSSDDTHISIWDCHHHHHRNSTSACRCVGKICMVDIICYLSKQHHNNNIISSPLDSPISDLLSNVNSGLVTHVDPSSTLVDAIDLIINGAQNLVVPIKNNKSFLKRKQLLIRQHHPPIITPPTIHSGGREFCWLTQEDVIRFLLGSIALFSPTAAYSIDSLGIITTDVLTVNYHSPASEAVDAIRASLADQTSVAVVDDDGVLIGEISPFTLAYCDETVAAAIATLSAGDLMAYIDCGGPPEGLVRVVEERLKERNLKGVHVEPRFTTDCNSNSSSSDEETTSTPDSTTRSRRYKRSSSYSARMMRRSEAIVCYPRSSLVAVMIQAIAHRVNYVWVIEDDCRVVGIARFSGILEVFRDCVIDLEDKEGRCCNKNKGEWSSL